MKSLCAVTSCDRTTRTRGWCNAHYLRYRKYGTAEGGGPLVVRRDGSPCVSPGCKRPVRCKSLCASHYSMLLVYGRTEAVTADGRFWSKVTEDRNGCWIWKGARNPAGCGNFYWPTRPGGSESSPYVPAHRYAYQDLRCDIPDGLHLDHMCRVPACVNPWHLEPVSPGENTRRAVMLGGLAGTASIRLLEEYRKLRAEIRANIGLLADHVRLENGEDIVA